MAGVAGRRFSGVDVVGRLLWRGLLVGVLAGPLSFTFLKVDGEPAVDRAVAFEKRMDQARDDGAKVMPEPEADHEIFSRSTQSGIGLLTGVGVNSVAFGGLFSLVFAVAFGRMGRAGPRTTAALLALLGFVAIHLVPSLKYPANPLSVGDPATIGLRTGLYFGMMLTSVVTMLAAGKLRLVLLDQLGEWEAAIAAAAFYGAAVVLAGLALPTVDEVPEGFPATVLWQFRVASLGAQAILWTVLGLAFGFAVERLLMRRPLSLPAT